MKPRPVWFVKIIPPTGLPEVLMLSASGRKARETAREEASRLVAGYRCIVEKDGIPVRCWEARGAGRVRRIDFPVASRGLPL